MLQHSRNCDTRLTGFARTTRDGLVQERQAPAAEPLLHRTPNQRGCNGRLQWEAKPGFSLFENEDQEKQALRSPNQRATNALEDDSQKQILLIRFLALSQSFRHN